MSRRDRLWGMRQPTIVLAILASIMLGACGAGGPVATGSPGTTPGPGGIDGRTFLSTSVTGQALVTGSRIRLTFSNGQLSANAGCNTMSGAYRIDAGTLRAPQLATTDMGCEQGLMAQDQWVAALFDGATVALDGDTLTLNRNGIRVTLLDRVIADPDRPLLGTRWDVNGIISGGTASSIPQGANAWLTFSPGQVDVQSGCNTGGGSAAISGSSITFGPIVMTGVTCASDSAAVEKAIRLTLDGTATYLIQADTLTLQAGATGLMLRAAP
jgi:heat shock protein HslJ